MQPYSELANWDGSLSAPVPSDSAPDLFPDVSAMAADSLSPPSLSDPTLPDKGLSHPHNEHQHVQSQSHPMYDHLYKLVPHSDPHQPSRPLARPSSSDSPSPFGPPNAFFPPNGHESVLSPQEREIMADITLDPDDPAAWAATQNDASKDPAATMPHSESSSSSVISRLLQQQHLVAPSSSVIAPTSASISPSPFAPPALSSLSPSSHLSTQAPDADPVHSDKLAISARQARGSEYVMEHTPAPGDDSGDDGATLGDAPHSIRRNLELQAVEPPDRASSQQGPLPPLDTANCSSSSRSSVPPRHSSRTPLFLPSPSDSLSPTLPHPPERDSDLELQDVISITSSSSSSSSPPPSQLPRRSTRNKSKTKRGRQLMAYILVPPLPSGMRKSDYMPLEQVLHMRDRMTAARHDVLVGDNSGPTELAAVLQRAIANNWSGAGSTAPPGSRRREKQKALEPMEAVEVVDDDDEDEDEGETRIQGSTTLASALSKAFTHNSADPKVLAPAAVARSMRRLRSTHGSAKNLSYSTRAEINPSQSTERYRAHLRPRVTQGASFAPVSRQRNAKRQPQTPSSPQRKRRRLDKADERGAAEEGEEIEIVDDAALRRSPRTKPHRPDPPPSKLSRTKQQRRTSKPRPMGLSVSTASTLRSPSSPPPPPLPQSPASSTDINTLSGLPLTILPSPATEDIVIPPRALNHLHAPPDPPDPGSGFRVDEGEGMERNETQAQHESRQDFYSEDAAIGARGLLDSPTTVAAIVPAATTAPNITTESSTGAATTDLQRPFPDVGLGVVVPMETSDGGQEQVQEQQDAIRAAVVPPHALRISSSTHPEGPMLGFLLSEHHEGAGPASLSADADTDASSDGLGLELGNNAGPDLEFMFASLNPNFSASAGWIDWGAAGPSTGVAIEGEYVGDGTIDPSVLGGCSNTATSPGAGSPGKGLKSDSLALDGCYLPRRSPTFMRAVEGDKYSDNMGDEVDVVGLLFEDSADDDFVPPPSAGGAGGKGKGKAIADATYIGAVNKRIRRKSWRKALADNNRDEEDNDTEATEADYDQKGDNVQHTSLSPPSSLVSAQATFCHHCRRKTFRRKMRCTRVRESTGRPCRKMYCDLCIEKRYPSLTFDEFSTAFSCPCCYNFCNCSLCARARGETYISERNGGWRKWGVHPPAAAATTPSPTLSSPLSQRKQRKAWQGKGTEAGAGAASTAAEVIKRSTKENLGTAMSMVISNPLGGLPPSTLVPTSQLPPSETATAMAVDPSLPVLQRKKRRYVYIGKRLKAWGRLVAVPDPEEQVLRKKTKGRYGVGQGRGKRKRAGRIRTFVGSEEPLLLGRKRMKRAHRERSTSLPPSSSPVHRGGNQNADEDAQADVDVDEGVWPGEYVVEPGVVAVEKVVDDLMRIAPEELERAISAAFAVGSQ